MKDEECRSEGGKLGKGENVSSAGQREPLSSVEAAEGRSDRIQSWKGWQRAIKTEGILKGLHLEGKEKALR